jgi:hypothetical protein
MIHCKEIRTKAGGSWDDACRLAEDFINSLPAETSVVAISHVSEPPYAVIFVWHQDGKK